MRMTNTKVSAGTSSEAAEDHGYHSAVEIDENVGSWKDWAGPAAALLFLVCGLAGLALTINGSL